MSFDSIFRSIARDVYQVDCEYVPDIPKTASIWNSTTKWRSYLNIISGLNTCDRMYPFLYSEKRLNDLRALTQTKVIFRGFSTSKRTGFMKRYVSVVLSVGPTYQINFGLSRLNKPDIPWLYKSTPINIDRSKTQHNGLKHGSLSSGITSLRNQPTTYGDAPAATVGTLWCPEKLSPIKFIYLFIHLFHQRLYSTAYWLPTFIKYLLMKKKHYELFEKR